MQKYFGLSKLVNILPEAIALSLVFTTNQRELFHICSLLLRFIWQSAIIVHGLGHTVVIAISDRELSNYLSSTLPTSSNIKPLQPS